MNSLDYGAQIMATATSTTAAIATVAGVTGKKIYITTISGSSDKVGALILVKDGATVIWQDIVNAGNYGRNFATPLVVSLGGTATVTVDGTALCNANLSGVQL